MDELKDSYIGGELESVETTQWYPKVMRKDYTVGLNITETGVDDPDVLYYENYVCGAARNYTGYCSPQVDKLVDRQSMLIRLTPKHTIVSLSTDTRCLPPRP